MISYDKTYISPAPGENIIHENYLGEPYSQRLPVFEIFRSQTQRASVRTSVTRCLKRAYFLNLYIFDIWIYVLKQ